MHYQNAIGQQGQRSWIYNFVSVWAVIGIFFSTALIIGLVIECEESHLEIIGENRKYLSGENYMPGERVTQVSQEVDQMVDVSYHE